MDKIKIQRPGNTETNLLFINYLKDNYPHENFPREVENIFIEWLYSTSGFYDKNIKEYSKEKNDYIKQNINYKKWVKEYYKCLNNSTHISFYIENPLGSEIYCEDLFTEYLLQINCGCVTINNNILFNKNQSNFNHYWSYEEYIDNEYRGVFCNHYDLLKDKIVLIISAFSDLIEYQHKNAVHKIFTKFPNFNLITYKSPYTFLNDGPHSNFFETLSVISNDIYKLNFDIALLSCGTYATFLIDIITENMNRSAIYMGRGCNFMFGIDPNKDPAKYHPLWMTKIPKHLIYEHADKIENGIYWYKQ